MTGPAFQALGCEVVLSDARPEVSARVRDGLARVEATFSRFRADSELAQLNRSASETVAVSRWLASTLLLALRVARRTNGLVDPTIGGSLRALGYDRDIVEITADAPARPLVVPSGWRHVSVCGTLVRRPPSVELDLNGVVKGRAVDAALAALPEPGFVSIGGDLATSVPVDVELPDGPSVRLVRGGMATSGSTTRSWRRGGDVAHHLVDPLTGASADVPWAYVTVAGRSCLVADVAAKAAFLLGDAGPAWLDGRDLSGRFVRDDGSVTETRSWADATTGVG